jgi:hypothetical protein
MKWATIISGQPRADINSSYKDYSEFIEGIGQSPDVFCRMMESSRLLSVWGNSGWGGSTTVRTGDEVINLWSPKKHKSDWFDDLEFSNDEPKLAAGLSMTYGIKKSFELLSEYEKDNNIKYDYVIKWRYDLFYKGNPESRKPNTPLYGKLKDDFVNTPCSFWDSTCYPEDRFVKEYDDKIDWGWIINEINDQNTVVVSPGWCWDGKGYCDLMLVGSRNAMERYSRYHDEFRNITPRASGNEHVLQIYLAEQGIRVLNYFFGDIGVYR